MTWAITWFYEIEVISPQQDKIIQDRFNLVIRSNLIYASRKALNKIFFEDFFPNPYHSSFQHDLLLIDLY